MNKLDQYIYDSILISKKPGGVKISNLKKRGYSREYSDCELYCLAKNIGMPICPYCNEEPLKLKTFTGGEFTDFCSMSCYSRVLSERNTLTNRTLNSKLKARSDLRHQRNKMNQMHLIDLAIEEYMNISDSHMKFLSEKYGVTYRYLRDEIVNRGLLDKGKQSKVFKENLSRKLATPNKFLENAEWIQEKIDNKWSTAMVANEIGCSANYVSVKSRKLGLAFPNNKTISSREIVLKERLEQEGYRVETNDRKFLDGKEIDIILPDYDIGIEVNGVYWHQYIENSVYGKNSDKHYHKNKTDDALSKGLTLMHIYDYEIDNPIILEKIIHIIKSKTGKNKKIFARKCEVKNITSNEYNKFLRENHFKGAISSKVKIGLYYNNEIISCMGFSSPRFNKKYQWELIRLCTKQGITVTGGAEKMLSYFLKTNGSSSIISYCDRRLFNGAIYEKIGMKRINISNPSYHWVKYNGSGIVDLVSRYQSQKHKISTPETIDNTETDIMRKGGYMKIYDSGQDTWILGDENNNYDFLARKSTG